MHGFLTSAFSHSYSRIYNGMLQRNGAKFVSKYIENTESAMTPDKFIETHATSRPTDPVYEALKDVYEIRQAGYAQLLGHLRKEPMASPLRTATRAVVLRIDENERWKAMFDAEGTQFDLLLAVPALSRIVSVSTSKIENTERGGAPKPFDVLELSMYQFYEAFNKLHGSSHRKVAAVRQSAAETAGTFDSVKFALRTIRDAKMLADCANMRLYSSFSGGENQSLGFYFLCACRIVGFEPRGDSAVLALEDDSGGAGALMDAEALELSGRLLDVPVRIGACKSGAAGAKLQGYGDLVKAGDYFLILCRWPAGSDEPRIVCAMPMGDGAGRGRLYAEALLNTRRKMELSRLESALGGGAADIVEGSVNLTADRSGKWVYYKDPEWDGDALSFLAARGFERPGLSEILKSGLPRSAISECKRLSAVYLKNHEYARRLYLSDDPEAELADAYPPIARS